MRKTATITLFPLLLLACAGDDPDNENGLGSTAERVGDAASPANYEAAEGVQRAALPAATAGLRWTYSQQDRIAQFGPPGSPALSIQCQRQREAENQLVFIRYLPPAAGRQATLSFTGNGQLASLPVSAVSNPDGIGGQWRAVVPPDDAARNVADTFAGPDAVEVSVNGSAPLVVPSTAEPRRVLADCLSGQDTVPRRRT